MFPTNLNQTICNRLSNQKFIYLPIEALEKIRNRLEVSTIFNEQQFNNINKSSTVFGYI